MKDIKKGLTDDFSGSFTARYDQVNATADYNSTTKSRKNKDQTYKLVKNSTSDFAEEMDRSPMIGGGAGARAYYDDNKSNSDAASSLGSLNNQQEKDLQEYIAEENQQRRIKIERRTALWQLTIFLFAFAVNQLISFRDHVVINMDQETPDSVVLVTINLFRGIGYLIIGNLYDNVRVPQTLTFKLLIILALLTSLCALIPEEFARGTAPEDYEKYGQLVTQMSSVRLFESGVQMACLIILFNWFPLRLSGFVVSIWQASYLIIPLSQFAFDFKGTENYVRYYRL